MATVTNRMRAPRAFALANGRHAAVAPGRTVDLDLAANNPSHAAWAAAGHVSIVYADPEVTTTPAPAVETTPDVDILDAPGPDETTTVTEDAGHERKRRGRPPNRPADVG